MWLEVSCSDTFLAVITLITRRRERIYYVVSSESGGPIRRDKWKEFVPRNRQVSPVLAQNTILRNPPDESETFAADSTHLPVRQRTELIELGETVWPFQLVRFFQTWKHLTKLLFGNFLVALLLLLLLGVCFQFLDGVQLDCIQRNFKTDFGWLVGTLTKLTPWRPFDVVIGHFTLP